MQQTPYVPCPQCGSTDIKKVGFTWWGGALGPSILKHVKCNACGKSYNGITGKDNTTGMIIYLVVSIIVGCLLAGVCILIFELTGGYQF